MFINIYIYIHSSFNSSTLYTGTPMRYLVLIAAINFKNSSPKLHPNMIKSIHIIILICHPYFCNNLVNIIWVLFHEFHTNIQRQKTRSRIFRSELCTRRVLNLIFQPSAADNTNIFIRFSIVILHIDVRFLQPGNSFLLFSLAMILPKKCRYSIVIECNIERLWLGLPPESHEPSCRSSCRKAGSVSFLHSLAYSYIILQYCS